MYRRFLVTLLRRSILALLLICLGCSAQSAPTDVAQRVERQVRAFYSIPPHVKITLSPLKPSEFPNYDALTITFDSGDKKQNYDFLLSKDGQTLFHMTKLDLNKDPYAAVKQKIDLNGRSTLYYYTSKLIADN